MPRTVHALMPATLATLLVASAAMADPSFDCAKAASDAETAICGSEALAELDVELARLYALALHGPHATPEGTQSLKEMQRGWIKGRDECWKSALGLEACIAIEYAFRIDEIRTGYADARAVEGVSLGPFAYACEGLDAGLSAGFVNSTEPMVVLRWRENGIALPLVPAGSGARYASNSWNGGAAEFWTHGESATFTPPGGTSLSCQQDDIG